MLNFPHLEKYYCGSCIFHVNVITVNIHMCPNILVNIRSHIQTRVVFPEGNKM